MPTLRFRFTTASGRRSSSARIGALVIAGWTGRDAAAVEAHVRELEELGVPRPRTTPLFYRVSADLLTQAAEVAVLGGESSGEAEAVIVATSGGLWVGVGSDHTDRHLERLDVARAKQCCAKAIGRELWPLGEVQAHWDSLMLRSHVQAGGIRELYQEGTLAELQSPRSLLGRYAEAGLAQGAILFCGTLPVRGVVRGASRFEMELIDPVLGRTLHHAYTVRELPIVE